MHREHAVEHLGRDEIVVRTERQLDAHDRRFDSANDQEHQGEQNIHEAQPLVIDRDHPLVQRRERERAATVGRNSV